MSRSLALRTSKNTLMLLMGNIIRMVATFGFVLYSAALLGLEGFGKYSIALNLYEMFLGLAATAVGILLTRDVARWPRHTDHMLTSAMAIAMLLSLLAPLLMLWMGTAFGYASDTIQAIGVSALALLPGVLCVLLEAVFVAKQRAEFVTMGTAFESLLRIGLSVAALQLGYGLLTLMGVIVVSRCALLFAYWFTLWRLTRFQWKFRWTTTKRFALRWRVFAAENWLAAVYTNLDVLILSWISGEAAVGLYTAAGKFVRLGAVFSRSFTTAVFPVMSRMFSESPAAFDRFYQNSIRVMYTMAFPLVIGVSVMTERIVGLLYTSEYDDAVPVLRVLIWLVLFEFLNPFLSHVLFAQGRQHRSMYVAGISLCANSIVCLLLVRQFGAVGAALGSVCGGFIAMSCYMAFAIPRRDVVATFTLAFRVLIAALGMGAVLFLMRNELLIAIGLVSVAIYVALLFLVQAVRSEDIRFFRTTFLSRVAS